MEKDTNHHSPFFDKIKKTLEFIKKYTILNKIKYIIFHK